MRGAASSDEEDSDEEDKTVVLSAKDKRFVEMDQAIKMIQDKSKVNDWVVASSGTSFAYTCLNVMDWNRDVKAMNRGEENSRNH